MTRFCPSCDAEVTDTGGYCLLGHRMSLFELPEEPITDLRAEVEQVFEAARQQLAAVLESGRTATPETAQPSPAPAPVAVAPAPPAAAPVPAAYTGQVSQSPPFPPAAEHIPTLDQTPPAPPMAAVEAPAERKVWAGLGDELPLKDDPIEAFAPSPRMDWGPERQSFFRRRSHTRRPSTAVV